jgi:hypothetical protein
MESTVFFERKVSLTPKDMNKIGKSAKIADVIMEKLREVLENKCSEHGFVLPSTLKLISRSMGYFENGRFTGDAVYHVKSEGRVILPADGVRIIGTVLRKNRMGLYITYRDALRIQVPRDLHLENEEFDSIKIGDTVEVELKKSLFQINDEYILTNGLFIGKREASEADTPVLLGEQREPEVKAEGKAEGKEEEGGEEEEGEEGEEEGGEEEEAEEEVEEGVSEEEDDEQGAEESEEETAQGALK